MKRGKKYIDAAKTIDRAAQYDTEEAISLVKKSAVAKFDETIECHIRTGCDGRHADQQIRGAVVLPNGTGKTVKVLVFAKGAKADEAEAAGADGPPFTILQHRTVYRLLDSRYHPWHGSGESPRRGHSGRSDHLDQIRVNGTVRRNRRCLASRNLHPDSVSDCLRLKRGWSDYRSDLLHRRFLSGYAAADLVLIQPRRGLRRQSGGIDFRQ